MRVLFLSLFSIALLGIVGCAFLKSVLSESLKEKIIQIMQEDGKEAALKLISKLEAEGRLGSQNAKSLRKIIIERSGSLNQGKDKIPVNEGK